MSDEIAIKQAVDAFEYVVRDVMLQRIAELPKQPESPIERMFLIGLLSHSYTSPCFDFGDFYSAYTLKIDGKLPIVKVELQASVEGYRADFLLTMQHNGEVLGRVVVECDGHSFHERTKEQAARDRSRDRLMTLAGYTVLRFTGSEIYRDVMTCVSQVDQAAWSFHKRTLKA